MTNLEIIKNDLKEELAKDLKEGIDAIEKILQKNKSIYSDLVFHKGKLDSIERDFLKDITSDKTRHMYLSKLRAALILLIDQIEKSDLTPEFRKLHFPESENLITIFIEDNAGNVYESDECHPDLLIGKIATDFFDAMGWSTDNRRQRAVVELVRGGRRKNKRLRSGQTLKEAGLINLSTLRIFPEAIAGGPGIEEIKNAQASTETLMADQIKSIIKGFQKINRQTIFPLFDGEEEENYCFVLMPFNSDALDEIYQDYVKQPLIKECKLKVERADDFFTVNTIIKDVWFGINRAKVIIAELTGRNPNVFYELGISHTLGKKVILISQNIEDVPSDLRHIRFIHYQFTPKGVEVLKKKIISTVNNILAEVD